MSAKSVTASEMPPLGAVETRNTAEHNNIAIFLCSPHFALNKSGYCKRDPTL
jgi:hypothetical protein